jgi:hypothetical protein
MVLATFSDHRSEQALSGILDSFGFGTPAFHVRNLTRLGYTVEYRAFTLNQLTACLEKGLFPIVFVDASSYRGQILPGSMPWFCLK